MESNLDDVQIAVRQSAVIPGNFFTDDNSRAFDYFLLLKCENAGNDLCKTSIEVGIKNDVPNETIKIKNTETFGEHISERQVTKVIDFCYNTALQFWLFRGDFEEIQHMDKMQEVMYKASTLTGIWDDIAAPREYIVDKVGKFKLMDILRQAFDAFIEEIPKATNDRNFFLSFFYSMCSLIYMKVNGYSDKRIFDFQKAIHNSERAEGCRMMETLLL